MTLITSITGAIPLLALWLSLHPIHVSVTEIEFDEKDRALEIMMRVFIDDLELSLRNQFNQPELDLLNPSHGTTTDELANKYIKQHFSVSLDGQQQKTSYLSHEREGEALIFYIEVKDVSKWKTISVRNAVIMATHEDQSNIVHVYVGERVKSLRLTRNTPGDDLTF
jgi:hypothetical protein